jgi:hypothetical protein
LPPPRAADDNVRVFQDDQRRVRVREAIGIVIIGLIILAVFLVRYGGRVDWHVR